ncbi:MAG: DUF1598 domain-containing protein [Pirellula sp.]
MRLRSLSLHGSALDCARRKLSICMMAIVAILSFGAVSTVCGQAGGGGVGGIGVIRVVGGVSITPDGVLRNASIEDHTQALNEMRSKLIGAQGELAQPTNTRLISLKTLQKVILQSIEQKKPLPEEVLYLGGLTRVENIFVYPERQDIVLSGPAEPWKVGENGSIVGAKSGRPVVYLEDLLGALATVHRARTEGISVSIEPTPEGVRKLEQLLKQVRLNANMNPKSFEPAMTQAFGPQQVKLTGLSPDSHMAQVILAADYRMKLYGMNLAKAPVKGLPSYIEMISNQSGTSQLQSRWWMECDYSAIEHSADRLAWRISGPGIKTSTEQDQITSDGSFKQTGKVDKLARKWADLFTSKLDELAIKDPVFGELRNVMDLCIVSAVIESQNLQSLAQCDLTAILGDKSKIELAKFDVAKSLDPQCSFIKTVQGWVVSASGGVLVNSWEVASKVKMNDAITTTHASGAKWHNDDRIWQ